MQSAAAFSGALGALTLALVSLGGAAPRGLSSDSPGPREPVDFGAEIRPLLSDRCFPCHGPGAETPGGGLRLDLEAEAVDELGLSAIVPGDAAGSALLSRARHADPERRMPPKSSNLSLSEDEIDLLSRWIDEGASYGAHWAFVSPVRSSPPEVANGSWCRDDLDRHVLSKLESAGIAPAAPADDATLLRRAHLDLTGLPPTPDEVGAYLSSREDDRYERVVDALLASTAHAERLTAHWLDVSRYADTFGYQSDVDMRVWPWRDWVIRAFESNLPYDAFLTHQLAGDLIPDADQESRLATAFNRLHRQTNEGGSVEEEYRVEYVCDRVETMAGAFLGLTVGCARCHDHKFDPLTQRDYFGLFAYFDGIDESGLYSHFTDATPTPALDLPTEEQSLRLAELDAQVRSRESALEDHVLIPWRTTYDGRFGAEVEEPAELRGGPEVVESGGGTALRLDGENSIVFPGTGVFERSDPFSLRLSLVIPTAYERAVILHRAKAWTDSGSRGYQLLVEEGHLVAALVHFWPGDAIAVRTREPIAVGEWVDVRMDYDGSSRAQGIKLYVEGEPVEVEVLRDPLTRTIRGGAIEHLTIGSRFRDNGFKGGLVRSLTVRELNGAASEELAALGAARVERDRLRDQVRQIMTMAKAPALPAAARTAFVLRRGVYSERGDAIGPRTPGFLPQFAESQGGTRLDLARWLTHPEHPLTARVHVDRLWRVAFGEGLVSSAADFGNQTPAPVHRALLDTLARELVESGWDSRALLRRFLLSATYRQSSAMSLDSAARDPEGALHSRALRTRFDAETIRDMLLAASGRLATTRGGEPVMPYQPPGLWKEKNGRVYRPGRGDDLRRRSLYTFWRRTSPPPTMTLFDAPAREVCRVERPATTTPLQSLVLWNDPQFVDVAVALARAAIEAGAGDDGARVDYLLMALATRPARGPERAAMTGLLAEQRAAYQRAPEMAQQLANFDLDAVAHGKSAAGDTPAAPDDIELAATAVVASTLLGLDDVVTRR